MATKYTGQSFSFDEADQLFPVTRAVITRDHLAVDWTEEGDAGGLSASSDDGVTYTGTHGYKSEPTRQAPLRHCEFRLYRAANGNVLLFGRRWRTDSPDGGTWVIELVPSAE